MRGAVTHVNQPVTGNAITGIDLKITFDITIDTTDIGLHDFIFHFAHDETPNATLPCPYGPPGLTGVNVNGLRGPRARVVPEHLRHVPG